LRILRSAFPIGLMTLVAGAHAQMVFSNVNASYTLNPGSVAANWFVFPDGAGMAIDFTQNAPAFKVGDSTSFSTGSSTITYDVTSPIAITSIDLTIQGQVEDFGEILFGEDVTVGATNIGSTSGSIQGASYSGGTNGAFTKLVHLDFSQAVTAFSVSQTMASDINNQNLPSSSIALVGTVEQNFSPVPEPTTFVGLGLGAAALLRRKRKK
jgi:hypothetical protein